MFRRIGMLVVGLVFVITLIPFSAQATDLLSKNEGITEPEGAAKIRVVEGYGKLPLHFEANQGQVDQRVRFLSRGSGYNLLLTSSEAVLTLSRRENNNNHNRARERNSRQRVEKSSIQTGTLWMRWEGANEEAKIEGVEGLDGKSHYFVGNDPEKWRRNISLYRKVRYRDLYPGIDLIYYGNQRQLEYDLIVMPEGDPNAIRLAVEGAEEVRVNEGGDLVVRISGGEVIQRKPLIYQEIEGKREIIWGGYVVDSLGKEEEKGKVRISFKIDQFDREKPLIIDPYLVYSTYLGGGGELGRAIAVDSSGSAYITGQTCSYDFPTINPIQGLNGMCDAFVTKFDPSGSALVYSTFLGGANSNVYHDEGSGIAVDTWGYAYVTGNTGSTDFPTLNAIQGTHGGGWLDGFVTKLDPFGSALVYSTYLGGNGRDYCERIVVDSSGNAYITGSTESTNFPTSNAFQPSKAGDAEDADAFVTKLGSSGALVYSTYLGGGDWDGGGAIAVDSSGNAYVTGETYSYNFPTKNPIQASLGGHDSDAFVTKLDPSGSALVYSTYLGGRREGAFQYDIDYGTGIAVYEDSGSVYAYVVGDTWCIDFPTVNPIQASNAGSRDVFIAKLNPLGTALVYSTYLGGSDDDNSSGIAVDSTGSVHITGSTGSTDFPTLDAIQGSNAGNWDAFVAKLNPSGSALVYSTYLGGNGYDYDRGIAADSSGAAYIAGTTSSTDFPTLNAIQGYVGGTYAFVTKIDSGTPTLSVTPGDGLISSGIQGGPFTPSSKDYTLQNTGGTSINWTASKLQGWTTLSSASGTLGAGSSVTVTVSINSGANSLTPGSYSDTVSFTNTTDGKGSTKRQVSLTVIPPGVLSVTPADGLTSSGAQGGPFTPSSKTYTLWNTGGSSINWTASKLQTWTTLPSTHGTLGAGSSVTVTVSINSGANSLTPGSYSDTVSFANTTNGNGNTTRPVSLTVIPEGTLSVTPADGLTSSGTQGGPFTPSSRGYTLQNIGSTSINWTASKGETWDTLSSTSGTLAAGASTTLTVSINANANALAPGSYSDTVTFTNTTNNNGNTTRPVSLTVIPPSGVLSVTPGSGLTSSGPHGGPFTPQGKVYTLQNSGGSSINWTASKGRGWDTLSSTSGTLGAGASTTVRVSINGNANSLAVGSYSDTVSFTNTTNGNGNTTRPVSLTVNSLPGVLSVTPSDGLTSSGNQGGPFSPSSKSYTLQNTGGTSISWTASKGQTWVTISSAGGTLNPGASATVTVSINSNANSLIPGSYSDTVTFTNTTNNNGNTTRSVSLTVNPRIEIISLQSPSNNTVFDPCALITNYQPTFTWTPIGAYTGYKILLSTSPTDFTTTGVKVASGSATGTSNSWKPSSSGWKAIMKSSHNYGNIRPIYWKVVGTRADKTIVESGLGNFGIGTPQTVTINAPLDAAILDPALPPAFDLDMKCNTKFRLEISSLSDFSDPKKIKKFTFAIKDPNLTPAVQNTLSSSQWKAVNKLIGTATGYFRVRAWDGIKRETISEIRSFTIQ